MVVNRIICLVMGYIFGLFQTGFIYGKLQHIDIREYGSGNAGTTNTLRTLGWKAGLITFFGDAGKAILSMLLAWILFHEKYPGQVNLLEMYAGLGAVLGHNFPFYMKFKGGKGIACTAGFLITFYPPLAILCLLVFVVTVAVTRYVSLGSILVSVCFYIQLIVFGQLGYLWVDAELLPEVYVVGAVFTILAIWRHRANVKRLLSGTENKFSISNAGSLNKNR
ncbi:glycerol-3-phosphate 1-O-acyltransferase PlsY [Lachnospiraceae bacterium KK002]